MPALRPPEMSDSTSASSDGGEQQRHADAVVEAALDVERLADPLRHARLGDDRLAQRGVGRRQHDAPGSRASAKLSSPKSAAAATAPSSDRQRQADRRAAAPARRPCGAAAPRSMRDASQNSTSASVASASARTVEPVLDRSIPSSTSGPTSNPKRDEQHRRRDRRADQPPRDRGDAEQRERHQREGPLHPGHHGGSRGSARTEPVLAQPPEQLCGAD